MDKYQRQQQMCAESEAGLPHARQEALDFLRLYGSEAARAHGAHISNPQERAAYYAALEA